MTISVLLQLEILRRRLAAHFDAFGAEVTTTVSAVSADRRSVVLSAPVPAGWAYATLEVLSGDAMGTGYVVRPTVAGTTISLTDPIAADLMLSPGDQVRVGKGPLGRSTENFYLIAPAAQGVTTEMDCELVLTPAGGRILKGTHTQTRPGRTKSFELTALFVASLATILPTPSADSLPDPSGETAAYFRLLLANSQLLGFLASYQSPNRSLSLTTGEESNWQVTLERDEEQSSKAPALLTAQTTCAIFMRGLT